jgi:hypothetical protein
MADDCPTQEIIDAMCRPDGKSAPDPRTTELARAYEVDFRDALAMDGHEWAKTTASYDFVETMIPRADDKQNLMWFGWALREAFVAGAEWQEKRDD